jgi:hypothetical protein
LADNALAFPLLDALSEPGFQASVVATYSCYFPFYEEVILRRLLDRGCTNNILLVDAVRCAEAFGSEDMRPRRAGSDYTLIPIHLRGAFHPKLILRIGKSNGSLFVGSHNMTLAGFGLNDELTNEFRTSGPGSRQGAGPIRAALDFLQFFVPTNLTELVHVLHSVRRNVPWLEGPIGLSSDARILMTTTGKDIDFWARLRPLIPKKRVMVFTCGPFFDGKLGFLKKLVSDVKPQRLVVGIDPESVEIDSAAVGAVRGAEFVNIAGLPRVPNRRSSVNTYLHAKVLWFKGSDGELLVTGSANPSAPAFLSDGEQRNAEAIVVDRRSGTAEGLGIDTLADAPSLTAQDWTRVKSRQRIIEQSNRLACGTLMLAVPSDHGFIAERPIGKKILLEAFGPDGTALGQAVTGDEDGAVIVAPTQVRDAAQTLRVRTGKTPVTLLVHRPEDVARNVGGDRQRELRRALGALEEDPAQLDTLLKLTEKVIFDSDDVISDDNPIRPKDQSASEQPDKSIGPESLAVEAAGRHSGQKKKSLATGDILVLLDALMYRLGEGLSARASALGQANNEGDSVEEEGADKKSVTPPPPYEVLAHACRNKVARLIRRMIKQLELAHSASARRAIVQLAAVLSVVHTLRTMEQRIEWRSKHLTLVHSDHEFELFENATVALSWGRTSLIPRALQEGDREAFKELSLALGLLAWLGWEVGIDVKAAVERTTPFDPEQEDEPWYPIQLFAVVAGHLAGDEEARENLASAVSRTPRRGSNAKSWLATHLFLADRLAKVTARPDQIRKLDRPPLSGDLVILRGALDPRVRVALAVTASGNTEKITVHDAEYENNERHVLATYVRYVPWWQKANDDIVVATG